MADSQRKTSNLFFKEISGGSIDANGKIIGNSSYKCCVGKISANEQYISSGNVYAFYVSEPDFNSTAFDNQRYVLSGITAFTAPIDGYIAVRYSQNESAAMLNTGTTLLPYEPYWLHSLRKLTTSTDTLTTLPADLYADGTNATVGLVGNMSQTGTPTPQNPIQPSECGDLSENLYNASSPNIFKGYYDTASNHLLTTPNNAFIYIPLVQGRKYYVYGCKRYNTSIPIRWATTSSAPFYNIPCIRKGQFAQTDIFTITAEANENYLAIFLCGDSDYSAYGTVEDAIAANGANLTIDNGYKIPISSANTTTPVYLGETQTTRKVYKWVLTGEEDWRELQSDSTKHYLTTITPDYLRADEQVTYVSSHYVAYEQTVSATLVPDGKLALASSTTAQRLYIADSTYTTNDTWKAYLAAQYSAGTPVTVWYVLATPTTGIVNEPIRKIGTYADTVSGITIPTITGKDTFDVQTTLKPSEVDLTYTGWHDASVKEKSRNLYNINAKDVNNGYVNSAQLNQDGTTEPWTPCEVTEYIELVPNVSYRLSKIGSYDSLAYCIYDDDKQYITGERYSGQRVKAINMPPNGKYVRFSHYKTLTETMLNEGSTALPYEPYWK